jgi:hypothetical protein
MKFGSEKYMKTQKGSKQYDDVTAKKWNENIRINQRIRVREGVRKTNENINTIRIK